MPDVGDDADDGHPACVVGGAGLRTLVEEQDPFADRRAVLEVHTGKSLVDDHKISGLTHIVCRQRASRNHRCAHDIEVALSDVDQRYLRKIARLGGALAFD